MHHPHLSVVSILASHVPANDIFEKSGIGLILDNPKMNLVAAFYIAANRNVHVALALFTSFQLRGR